MDHQAIHRSVGAMAFKIAERVQRKSQETSAYAMREVEMQYQIDISGEANKGVAWDEVHVSFDEVLYTAPGQRQNDNDEPHTWFGKVLDSAAVFIDAHVSDWDIDDSGHTTGCTVRVGVFDPSATEKRQFSGRLHFTVQGLGAPLDNTETDAPGG